MGSPQDGDKLEVPAVQGTSGRSSGHPDHPGGEVGSSACSDTEASFESDEILEKAEVVQKEDKSDDDGEDTEAVTVTAGPGSSDATEVASGGKDDNVRVTTEAVETPEPSKPEAAIAVAVASVSSGPYKLMPLISAIPVSNPDIPELHGGNITSIEAWDLNFYVGTSLGEIVHMYHIDDELGYIQLSRQKVGSSSKVRPVRKFVILPEISRVLVLCGKAVSGYVLPELSPGNIGRLKDVSDLSVDYDRVELDPKGKNYTVDVDHINGDVFCNVAVFTSKAIRLVRVFDDSMKLFKDVNYLSSVTGAQRSSYAAVSTNESYDLVDINRSQKIPLFPSAAAPEMPAHTAPHVLPVGKKEFLMVCAGRTQEDPAVGMVVNVDGDVSRGTIAWDHYPVSVAVDYPHIIATFADGSATVHSLHSQQLLQTMRFASQVIVRSVSRVFETKDEDLSRKLTKVPIIGETATPDEIEQVAIETDKARNQSSKSSCVIYNPQGEFVQTLVPYPRPLRWLDLYAEATERTYQKVYDEFVDEMGDKSTAEGQLILHLQVLLSMKFYNFNQAFEVLSTNLKYIDPRLIIYITDGSEYRHIYGTVWEFEGITRFIEQLQEQYTKKRPHSVEFMRLYLNICTASDSFKDPAVMKTIEIYLMNLFLDSNEDPSHLLVTIKYSSREVIEMLLLRKRYYYLSKLYDAQKNYQQCLYYWKDLISGDLVDPDYDANFPDKDKSLQMFVEYLLAHNEGVEEYGTWLLKEYPEYGFQVATAGEFEFNDVQVAHALTDSTLRLKYLEYVVNVKNKKQFAGDVVLEILKQLPVESVAGSLEKYEALRIPRVTLYSFWKLEKVKYDPQFVELHDKLYQYLSGIGPTTKSVLGQENVLEKCESLTGYPMLAVETYYRKADYEKVVSMLCDYGDYKTAEQVAATMQLPDLNGLVDTTASEEPSDELLMLIFDRYLKLGNPGLIDSFLSSHNLLRNDLDGDGSVLEKMDKFVALLNRIPDSFPVSQLHKFLQRSLSDFEDYGGNITMDKNLRKASMVRKKTLKRDLDKS